MAGFRGCGGHTGRRHRGDQSDLLQSNLVRAISNLSLNSYDSIGSTSRGRYRNDDFETPRHFQKKHRQEERRRIKVITGNTKSGNDRFRGAPEPSRDIFVYRTHSDTVVSDISDKIGNTSLDIKGCTCHFPEVAGTPFHIQGDDSRVYLFARCVYLILM